MLFNKVHERRVAKLARAIRASRSYNQSRVTHDCGTPGCVMGFMDAVFPDLDLPYRIFLFGSEPANSRAFVIWKRDVFGLVGCDGAGRSGKKAAAFIGQMARDLKAALAADAKARAA
jgi:hypothetical protein